MGDVGEFQKYELRGAYHWDALRRSVKRHSPYLAGRYRLVLELLRRAAPGGGRLLDIGCGDGALSFMLARDGWRVTGLDYSGTGLRLARRMFGQNGASTMFVRSDSCMLSIRDGSLDAVVAADIIEHLNEPGKLLGEMRRVLKKGGAAVVTTPVRLTERPADPEHVREYSAREFADLLEGYFGGVEVVQSHPTKYVERYGRTYRFLGLFGRLRPYRYMYNFMSSYMDKNPFLLPDAEGGYTQMSAYGIKDDS